MPDPTSFTNPLSGHEVIDDVLAQIRKRLSTDCNLRETDGYSGGYSGTVSVKLNLNAVRISEVEMTIPITDGTKGPSVDSFMPEDLVPVEVEEEIQIPLEPNLKEVRQRTVDNNDEAEQGSEPAPEPVIEATTVSGKRRYARESALAGVSAVTD